MEYGHVNSAATSKINWAAGIAGVVGLLSSFDIIPKEAQAEFNSAALVISSTLIVIFRTWFTVKPV